LSKFQSKCDEGILLGYSSCSKAYRVYNKTHGIVEETYDVDFDESNGCQDVQDKSSDVRPREEDESDGPTISIRVNPSNSTQNDQIEQVVEPSNEAATQDVDQLAPSTSPSTSTQEPVIERRFIMMLLKTTPLIKLWETLVRVFKLDLVLLHFVNIILLYLFLSLTV
jgi:hypothetical protein